MIKVMNMATERKLEIIIQKFDLQDSILIVMCRWVTYHRVSFSFGLYFEAFKGKCASYVLLRTYCYQPFIDWFSVYMMTFNFISYITSN